MAPKSEGDLFCHLRVARLLRPSLDALSALAFLVDSDCRSGQAVDAGVCGLRDASPMTPPFPPVVACAVRVRSTACTISLTCRTKESKTRAPKGCWSIALNMSTTSLRDGSGKENGMGAPAGKLGSERASQSGGTRREPIKWPLTCVPRFRGVCLHLA
jgi:hypothetical protein